MRENQQQLQPWCVFLDKRTFEILSRIKTIHGGPFVATETDVAFLQVDNSASRETVEQAINDFIRAGAWPPDLTFSQLVNLQLRLTVASHVLLLLLNGRENQIGIPIPDPGDQAKFARWLLIDAWNVGGADYIKGLTNAFLAEKSK